MTLDLNFVYYRNFRYDGKLHVRCHGPDLHKVNRIRYELERHDPDGPVSFKGVSVYSQARSGKLSDHGCPATLVADEEAGIYSIRPRVVLLDEHAQAMNRPLGAAGVIDMPPLMLEIKAGENNRSVLDKIPLPGSGARRKRSAVLPSPAEDALPLPVALPPGSAYPALLIEFGIGGHERFVDDLEPGSGSTLLRLWPNLKAIITLRPVLDEQERGDDRLRPLRQ